MHKRIFYFGARVTNSKSKIHHLEYSLYCQTLVADVARVVCYL